MNQFKKAKQKQLASGRPIESISDLQTAGVKKEETKKEIIKEEVIKEEIKVEEKEVKEESAQETKKTETTAETEKTNEEITSNIQNENVIAEESKTEEVIVETIPVTPVITEDTTLNKEVTNEAEISQDNNEAVSSSEKETNITVSNENIDAVQVESDIKADTDLHTSNNINANMNNIVTTGETNKNETTIINESITVKEESAPATAPATIATAPTNENNYVAANEINSNIVENTATEYAVESKNISEAMVITNVTPHNTVAQFEASQPVIQVPVMTPVNTQNITEPIVQQPMNVAPVPQGTVYTHNVAEIENRQMYQNEYPVYSEAVIPKQTSNKAAKKNIPNIFAPKGEAKSMRKSLVLKPTSVKIAENYCAKNGGSFNELIQTLLDNFIDEYGL